MSWVKIDDQMPDHPKFARLPGVYKPFALALQLCALCWCNRFPDSGGLLPYSRVGALLNFDHIGYEVAGNDMSSIGRDVDAYEIAAAMVKVGIWHECDEGYAIHDYSEYQPSRAESEAKRAALHEVRSFAGKRGQQALQARRAEAQVSEGKTANTPANTTASRQQDFSPVPVPEPLPKSRSKDSSLSFDRSAPNSTLCYFAEKNRRDAKPEEARSLAALCRKYGKGVTEYAIGQAAVQGAGSNLALITTIAKSEKGAS